MHLLTRFNFDAVTNNDIGDASMRRRTVACEGIRVSRYGTSVKECDIGRPLCLGYYLSPIGILEPGSIADTKEV